MEISWKEIVGYLVSFFTWLCGYLPTTCEGWTQLFALAIVVITFFFITLPKAWDFQVGRYRKKKNLKRRKDDEN